ncbi:MULTISPECIES: FtsK/SpoIIIE domain-containing protein [unclassified Paenibacillus]|uniref:FtsK/SpoIIIE domain-containing protein n=1 Tax=unclassified Paenibacillus TaxID=185978 RepID=UPI0024069063|nr:MULTISPECIES: FtsK/SpoIIIE domain-containing protein [unclassified Paenibacillus]MDF9843744.1 S-DNA-T family DNA segregation ATPase FtsK/SpoIIIE [Paenibacillus sp. PastF-2]MDF9850417.1 S-DNA-T family DNA segregation ATPase FtsK/SpoIIIE [Paenibacillus sp. PastM-2]MDF9856880.1 S-DNA-T family DNA segregation ATPase FtsK/SpoIIIE [Paenibacillus sp. PastF-1]MDH6482263.1 S-DNA-T family DNA segregation ATPase FtsK/SpoIIIE [Paenibacillus sp. PastH-2]MDH6509573.1 S-DNA-T family DNA segregation ATPase
MNQLELIGQVATEYLRRQLQSGNSDEGVARFLLDRLTGDQVSLICKTIRQDALLSLSLSIKVPRKLVEGNGLPDEMVTDEKTTYWRNASCDKPAILLANTNDDQGQSLRDIARVGAGDLKSQPEIWVQVASKDLPLTDDQKKYWQQSLKGLQEASECSLEEFSEFVVMVREVIFEKCIPVVRALGWALPALRIPRDSYFFDSIPDNALGHASRWKKKFLEAYTKRACYLYKQHPNRQLIENSDIMSSYEKVKSEIDPAVQPIMELFINSNANWSNAAERLAQLEWEGDKVNLLFFELKPMKINLAERTRQLYEDEFPNTLTDEELIYLSNLDEFFKKRKAKEATEEDKEFYDKHRQNLETDKSLKAEWDRYVYGKAIDCSDFLVGLLEATERLFAQCDSVAGMKSLKIRTQKTNSKKSWLDLNEDVALYFCCAYRGLEKLTDWQVNWETHHLFKYDHLVAERKQKENKKNTSTARSAIQIAFYIELTYHDLQGTKQKNDVKLIWQGDPLGIGLELYDDLKRLADHPFSYSTVSQNPVSKKGKLQGLSLSDIGTLQAVFGQDRGSLVGVFAKTTDLEKVFLNNLKSSLKEDRLSQQNYDSVKEGWVNFSEKYKLALKEWLQEGINSDSIIEQCELYDEFLRTLHKHALGDVNRIDILQPVMSIGNVKVDGDKNKPMTIISPWHPMRMVAKSVKARQVIGLINYVLTSEQIDFGDQRLFFMDLKEEILNPYYPEVSIGYKGQEPILLAITDTKNDYTLMESPLRDDNDMQTNEDPKQATDKLLQLVQRYLDLQPHEKTNLSIVLYNCDSIRLPETIVNSLANLHETEDEVRCQVILRHRDTNKLNELYMKMVESTDNNADSFVASEVTRDFMARLRVGVMAHEASISDPKEGKLADIVFLQDVISRQAILEWDQVQIRKIPDILDHYPPRWAKRRSTAKDELKSTVYLTCPSQPSVGWSYLSTVYSVVKGKDVNEGTFFLPARQISFQNEKVKAIFDEAHKLGEWVVNYDELLERRQLKNLGVKVIKYQHNKSHGSNIVVSSKSQLNLLNVLVKRRLNALNLNLSEIELVLLTERFIDDANTISGDIVLRAAKRGVCAGELIGVVLSKAILQSEMEVDQPTSWFLLDDYATWLGQKEEQIADILALSPKIIENKPHLQVFISEAKYVDAKNASEAKKNSSKQLRDTVSRMDNAIFGNPGRLDRDLWLSRLSDMLNDGIELPPGSPYSVEELREGIRNGSIPIEIKGYSHVFLSTLPDSNLESERFPIANSKKCYQEMFTRDLVRDLILAYHKGESIISIREKFDDSKPWEIHDTNLPAPRVNFLAASNTGAISIVEDETTKANSTSDEVAEDENNDIEDANNATRNESVVVGTSSTAKEENNHEENMNAIPWATTALSIWIEDNAQSVEENIEDQTWVSETVNKLRMALISYNLQAKVISHRLTPNAIVIRLKGSDQLKVDDVEKRRSILLTTHALDVINIMAQPGEIVVSLARPHRQGISLADVWKLRKVQNDASGLNMSFVIGVKELDGEILYLNLGGEFEGGAQHAPHTLIAGATGSGKSVLLQNLILDICVTNSKNLAHIYLIDPKYGVDYMHLADLPHLVEGIIDDQNKAAEILEEMVVEMNNRYQKFKEFRVNNLKDFNAKVTDNEKLPLIFLIHDEFAEWMLIDDYKSAVSSIVQRLGVKARAAGIHLIFAAQRPDANVLPVQLRDNLGNRLILRVESVGTSEISLGEKGAEKLLGKGHLVARLQGEPSLVFAQVPYANSSMLSYIVKSLDWKI